MGWLAREGEVAAESGREAHEAGAVMGKGLELARAPPVRRLSGEGRAQRGAELVDGDDADAVRVGRGERRVEGLLERRLLLLADGRLERLRLGAERVRLGEQGLGRLVVVGGEAGRGRGCGGGARRGGPQAPQRGPVRDGHEGSCGGDERERDDGGALSS